MTPGPVAVLDLGSNSIKILVAQRGADGGLEVLHTRTIDARISAGISRAAPRLSEEGMQRGLDALRSLLADAREFSATTPLLVATSAVRDAVNGAEFRDRVQEATGFCLRILTGDEEANSIGRGLTCEPALRGRRDFYVLDLGGGSLECLAFADRTVRQAVSLPLGCVRLTERFVSNPTLPVEAPTLGAIAAHVRQVLATAGFAFALPSAAIAVGTGGTVTTARAILGAQRGQTLAAASPLVTLAELQKILSWLAPLPLDARRQVPGLPSARADVFPAALATVITVLEIGHLGAVHHSFYNLRYGLAADALGIP